MVPLPFHVSNLVERALGNSTELRRRVRIVTGYTISYFILAVLSCGSFVDAQDSNSLVRVEMILRPDKNGGLEKSPSVMNGAVWLNDAQLLQEDDELRSILEFTSKQQAQFSALYREYRTVVAAEYPGAVYDPITVQKAVEWLGGRQKELTEILTASQQQTFRGAVQRHSVRQLGIVRALRSSNSQIRLSNIQRDQLQKSMEAQRRSLKDRHGEFQREHAKALTEILGPGQINEYNELFQDFVAEQLIPIEVLAFQLSLNGEESFLEETQKKSLNAFHLPSHYALLPSGRLNVRWSLDVSSSYAPLATMWLLMDPKMVTKLELSENQINEIKSIATEFQREDAKIKAKRPLMSSNDFSDDPKIFLERSRQSEQAMERYNNEVVGPFYRSIEKSIDEVLIPQQKRQLSDTILQVEIQRLGVSGALAFGQLGKRLKVTEGQRDWIVKWRTAQLKDLLQLMSEFETQLLTEVAEIIGKEQQDLWDKQIGLVDAEIWPAPSLLLTEPIVEY